MKKMLFPLAMMISAFGLQAQIKTTVACPEFSIDILDGKINSLSIKANNAQIKSMFPCFSSAEDEASAGCGTSVFYKEKDIYFYTERNYIEIGPGYKGKLTLPLMGAARNSLFKWLGNPKLKDPGWDVFQTSYGILILYYNKAGKVNKIQLSVKSPETIKLCE